MTIEIEKVPDGWYCTVAHLYDRNSTTGIAVYRVGESGGICQECFDAIRAYEPPKPRYEVKRVAWAQTDLAFVITDGRLCRDVGWLAADEAQAVCDFLNARGSSDE